MADLESTFPRRRDFAVWATCLAVLALLFIITWPLAAQLGRSLPGDYGDPVFVSWVIGWVNGRITDGAWRGLWDANIFFPERNTLAYSEHFIGQSLMVLPVFWFTNNPILSYNVAFILTFVLTAVSTFLLTRALVGSVLGAMVAALIATFNEYRLVWSFAHLHTLSLHWWLFALYACISYFVTDRRRYLSARRRVCSHCTSPPCITWRTARRCSSSLRWRSRSATGGGEAVGCGSSSGPRRWRLPWPSCRFSCRT